MTVERVGLFTAILLGVFGAATPARASFLMTLTQSGGNVVGTGSGTINLTDLTFAISVSGPPALVAAATGQLVLGPETATTTSAYSGFTGPTSFGTGALFSASSGSGNLAGIVDSQGWVIVPNGYASGTTLSDTSNFGGQTFVSLGLTPGTYTWNWGTGVNADSLTVQIGPTSPEPGSLGLLGIGALGMLWCRRRAKLL